MKRFLVGVCAVTWLLGEVGSASAAWDNVFQTTLFGRRRQTTTYYVAPSVVAAVPACCNQTVVAQAAPVVVANPCPQPCQPQCTTQYTQRCFYTPVTTYQTQTYYEPVTTMQTSYYYAPVTSYRYSCYYDPCTCSYQQVAVPTQSYELRSKCCPVQSWVQRCASVPVTSYQKSCYLYPQTTCCQTTQGAPIPVGAAPLAPPVVTTPITTPAPPAIEQKNFSPAPPVIEEKKGTNMSWQPSPQQPSTPAVAPVLQPSTPPIQLDRIAIGPNSRLEGQVVRADSSPRANAQIVFLRADRQGQPLSVTANSAGRFYANLNSGAWLVYLTNSDGTQAYHSRIDITGAQPPQVILTSR